jgi:AraC-like DNA-binding protein
VTVEPTGPALAAHYEPLINGEFRSLTSESFPAVDAATGRRLATITRGGAAEVDAAVAAARAAFPTWSATGIAERSRLLHRLADWVEVNLERLATIDTMDIGRTIFETPLDHRIAVNQYRFFAAAAITHDGWNHPVAGGWAIAKREPIGVVGQIMLAETRTPDGAAGSPLLRTQLFRLAAAALLEAYPSTFADGIPSEPGWASPAAVRRALAYIELRAADDIGLADIAAAARLSVRGLQAAFRRAGRATPLAELRRTRLRRAHAELRSRAPYGTTVGAVAGRWGFHNLSRFSAEHRSVFGCSPSEALNRD